MATNCILLSADLMLVSQAVGAAVRADCVLETTASDAQFRAQLEASPGSFVAIDLTTPGLSIGPLVIQLRALDVPPTSILAFGPHVHTARLEAATQAGCDRVLTRGQFYMQMEAILRDLAIDNC